MIAGALKPRSALIKLALNHPTAMVCQCFKPEGAGLEAIAISLGRNYGLRFHPGVAARLSANCLGDRSVLEREIDKLALYLDAAPDRPRDASEEALAAIGADLAEADTSRLVNAVLGGDLTVVTAELTEVEIANGWIPAIRALQRRIVLLARLRGEVDGGKSAASAVAALGKSLFFKEQTPVTTQLSRWPPARLATASARLFASERAIMASASAGAVLVAEELIAIARVGQRLK